MECERCGACCKHLSLHIEGMSEEDKLWVSYHKKCLIYENKLLVLEPCIYLKRKNDKYICSIHDSDKYPETCRMAMCLRKDIVGGVDELAFIEKEATLALSH